MRLPPDGRPSLAALAARRLALSRAAREEAARGLAVSRPSQRHETGETAPDAGSRKAAGNDCLTVSPPRDETVRQPAGAAGAAAPGPERRVGTADPDPVAAAERAAIQAEPPLPPDSSVERESLDAEQARTVAGLLEASRAWPSCFEGSADRPPPKGARCSACGSRRWWIPTQPKSDGTGPSAHYRCATCRPPARLREDQIKEVLT